MQAATVLCVHSGQIETRPISHSKTQGFQGLERWEITAIRQLVITHSRTQEVDGVERLQVQQTRMLTHSMAIQTSDLTR